jgi:hypothetical protein
VKAQLNANKVKAWMTLHDYSNRKLAQEIGVSAATIGRIINGNRSPSARFVQGMWTLGMNPNDIILPASCQKDEAKGKGV